MVALRHRSVVLPSMPAGSQPFFAVGAIPAYRLLTTMVSLTILLVGVLGFGVDRVDLPVASATLLFAMMLAAAIRSRGLSRPAAVIEAAALIAAATMATACLSLLFATTAFPYRDAWLDRADAILLPAIAWRTMFALLHMQDRMVQAMAAIYQTLKWQPFALVAVLAVTGDEARCWRFVHAWFLALALCLIVFPFVPAAGQYVAHGLTPADIPALTVDTAWRQVAVLDRVRSGALHALAPGSMTGLISFPSFHAAGATLLAWGYRRIRWIGGPFVALNVAMAATAPLIGAHYFVDVLAGIAIALFAIRIARGGALQEAVGIDVDRDAHLR